jgi:hypothetical protein
MKTLTTLTKVWCSLAALTLSRGMNCYFAWLAAWELNPGCRFEENCFCAYVKPPRLGGDCGPCPVLVSLYAPAFTLKLSKIKVNLSQGSRKVLGLSVPSRNRLVELAFH